MPAQDHLNIRFGTRFTPANDRAIKNYPPGHQPVLTARELEIACLAARGRSSKQIGAELYLSSRTVDNRLQNIFDKLGIHSRGDLARQLIIPIRNARELDFQQR